MLRSFIFLFSLALTSCATRYVVPTNRFITPESQGQAFRGQAEVQSTTGIDMTIDTKSASVDKGVMYSEISRTGYQASFSFFESIDFVWAHLGGGNSMAGAKFQFVGSSRTSPGDGHKAAAVVLFGGNEHEPDDESIEFELGGQEVNLVYGYRFSPMLLPYVNFNYSRYDFSGTIKKPSILSGLQPKLRTNMRGLSTGIELTYMAFLAKAECTYQQLETTDTKNKSVFSTGFSIGFNW